MKQKGASRIRFDGKNLGEVIRFVGANGFTMSQGRLEIFIPGLGSINIDEKDTIVKNRSGEFSVKRS